MLGFHERPLALPCLLLLSIGMTACSGSCAGELPAPNGAPVTEGDPAQAESSEPARRRETDRVEPAGPPVPKPPRVARRQGENVYTGPELPEEAHEVATKVVVQLSNPRTIDSSLISAPWVTKHVRVDDPSRVLRAAREAYRDARANSESAEVRRVLACPANRPEEEILATIGSGSGRVGLERMIDLGRTLPDAWIVWCDMAYTSRGRVIFDENILLVARTGGGWKVHGVD